MLFTPMVEGEMITEVAGMTVFDHMGEDTIRVRMEVSKSDREQFEEYGDAVDGDGHWRNHS